jgi:prophage regulatory protein
MNYRPERFLAVPAVVDRTTWSRSKLLDAVAKGEFPKPVRISPNRVAWPESVIDAWISAKIAGR